MVWLFLCGKSKLAIFRVPMGNEMLGRAVFCFFCLMFCSGTGSSRHQPRTCEEPHWFAPDAYGAHWARKHIHRNFPAGKGLNAHFRGAPNFGDFWLGTLNCTLSQFVVYWNLKQTTTTPPTKKTPTSILWNFSALCSKNKYREIQ